MNRRERAAQVAHTSAAKRVRTWSSGHNRPPPPTDPRRLRRGVQAMLHVVLELIKYVSDSAHTVRWLFFFTSTAPW